MIIEKWHSIRVVSFTRIADRKTGGKNHPSHDLIEARMSKNAVHCL